MGLLDSCDKYYGSKDLYEVFGVAKTCSQKELKKAYHKLSLKVHPDRSTDQKEISTQKFQVVGQIYSILSDKDKRAVYDETGEIDDENDVESDKDWEAYWRMLFPKVTLEDIRKFEEDYKGSEEESNDLKELYLKFEGDFDQIAENLMCYSVEDEPRLKDAITKMIDEGIVESFGAFMKEPAKKRRKRIQRYKGEAAEAEQHKIELGIDTTGSLQDLILKKNSNREAAFSNLMSNLEEKYCKPKSKGKSKRSK